MNEFRQMNKIQAGELKVGMKFSAPLFFDDGKNMFLPESWPITQALLSVLSKWNIDYIQTYGKEIPLEQKQVENANS